MIQQVARAVSIIDHMRQFGRKAEIQSEKVNVNEPLRAVFALLSEQLRVRGIKVKLDLQDDLPPILADSNRLEQVFIDLIVNARDAMAGDKEGLNGETVGKVEQRSTCLPNISCLVRIRVLSCVFFIVSRKRSILEGGESLNCPGGFDLRPWFLLLLSPSVSILCACTQFIPYGNDI